MGKTGLKIDIDETMQKLIKLNMFVKASAEVGVGRALSQLKTDMVMQRPTAPIKEGYLRGSISIFVQNKKHETPISPGEKKSGQAIQHTMILSKTQIKGIIGANMPYAARWHEVPAKFTEPSAGNKYLENKMAGNKMTYKKIIVNAINEKVKP